MKKTSGQAKHLTDIPIKFSHKYLKHSEISGIYILTVPQYFWVYVIEKGPT